MPVDVYLELKKPWGKVYSSLSEALEVIKGKEFVSIGDLLGYEFLENEVEPKVLVFDEQENNRPTGIDIREKILSYDADLLIAKNPSHHLTMDLWNVVKNALKSQRKTKIFVEGDETPSLIPLVLEAENGTIIVYKISERYVVTEVDESLKDFCKSLLNKMVKKKVSLRGR
ncbi:MAG: DUF359 domain-containing protein [Candidatus Aenigmarchaeota archaeon]|nr:DUF359 domain-containing protein [Candidatus Aenigmarchaeota archaeon]